jgi:hypothetical protein
VRVLAPLDILSVLGQRAKHLTLKPANKFSHSPLVLSGIHARAAGWFGDFVTAVMVPEEQKAASLNKFYAEKVPGNFECVSSWIS